MLEIRWLAPAGQEPCPLCLVVLPNDDDDGDDDDDDDGGGDTNKNKTIMLTTCQALF